MEELAEVPEKEVNIQAAFVGLIDHYGIVCAEQGVALDVGE